MSVENLQNPGFVDPIRNPRVSRFVSLLQRLYRRSVRTIDLDRWRAVEEVLLYAAEAERRLAEMDRQVKYLETLSELHSLTGVANRRGLEKFLDRTLADARRHKETGVVIFVDLDDFKSINDVHGHDTRDRMLVGVADVFSRNTRAADFVACLDGDEYVIVMPRTNSIDAESLAYKLQDILENTLFPMGDKNLKIRASFGAVAYDHTSKRSDLMCAADQAMYVQKRNRATVVNLFRKAR